MLEHPTLETLQKLKLTGMLKALEEQRQMPEIGRLSFEERLGLLVDREQTERENRRLQNRLKQARLRQSACLEDLNYRIHRGLDRALIAQLTTCEWVRLHRNVIITGPTGAGKSFLGCALAHRACMEGYTARYHRLPRLYEELELARGDGRYGKILLALSRIDVLVLDDWALSRFTPRGQRDLLEIFEDRYERRSTIVSSQPMVEEWHAMMANPTLADAILDRLIHNAYRIDLLGDSMRKIRSDLHQNGQ